MRRKSPYTHLIISFLVVGAMGLYFVNRSIKENGFHEEIVDHNDRPLNKTRLPSQENISVKEPEVSVTETETTPETEPVSVIPVEWLDVTFNENQFQIQPNLQAKLTSKLTATEKEHIKMSMGPYSILEVSDLDPTGTPGKLVALRDDKHHYAVVSGMIQLMKINPKELEKIKTDEIEIVKSYPRIKSYLIRPKNDSDLLKLYHELSTLYPSKVELEVQESFKTPR